MTAGSHLIKPHLFGVGESATLVINDISNQLIKQGKQVYKLGLGQSPFPVPEPVVETLKSHAHQKDYLPVKGLPQLKEAVADFHRKKDFVNIQPDLVMIGPGSKELLFLLQLVFDGEILVPSPCWVSYKPQSRIIKNPVTVINTYYENKWRLTGELLKEYLKTKSTSTPRLLILNYPGNPEGCTYNKEELKDIAETCRENNIYILSDEIYSLLHHEGKHVSIARYYPEGTIVSSGLSKWCGAGGWRLGTFSFPEAMRDVMNMMGVAASETFTSVSTPIQYAGIEAFKGSNFIEDYLWHARRILKQLGLESAKELREADIKVHDPEGAFYLFVDFEKHRETLKRRGIYTSAELTTKLLEETGVAVLPGTSFERPQGELTARLAYVDFDGATAINASHVTPLDEELDPDFRHQYCSNVVQGITKICEWVKD